MLEFLLTIFLLVLDQLSKFLIEKFLKVTMVLIPNFFELELTFNTGASWSILANQTYLLIGIAIFCLIALQLTKNTILNSKIKTIGYSLLYAGIIGNLIDRIVYHHVRDFFKFHFFGYQFPIFNVADIEIVIGTILMVYIIWKEEDNEKYCSRFRRKSKNR